MSENDVENAKEMANSLFHKLKIGEKLLEIEKAEKKLDFDTIIPYSSKL